MINGWDLIWLKTQNSTLVGRNPIFLGEFESFLFLFFSPFFPSFWRACVFGCDSSLDFWFLWLVVVVKVQLRVWLLGLYGNDFPVLLGYVVLSSISFFPIVFYIEDNVRFGCRGKAIENFEEISTRKSLGEFDFGKSLSIMIMHVLPLLCGFDSYDPCSLEIISSFD